MDSKKVDAELIAKYVASKDPALREAIILRYVPLVHFVIRRLGLTPHTQAEYEDLVSQGLLGLIAAVDAYDHKRGTQFSTYATVRIRGQILDYLRSIDWLPRGARRRAKAIQEANTTLWNTLHREPSDEELAEHLAMDIDQLRRTMIEAGRIFISLDASTEQEDEGSLHETLSDPDQIDPSEAFDELDLKHRLIVAMQRLSEREQLLLSLYYYEGLTMREVGDVLGVSESRVCQLHARTLLNVRSLLAGTGCPKSIKPAFDGRVSAAAAASAYEGTTGRVYEA